MFASDVNLKRFCSERQTETDKQTHKVTDTRRETDRES